MLHVRFGCMFAGKSKQLIEDAQQYNMARVRVISHTLAGPEPFVQSRNGQRIDCVKTSDIMLVSHRDHDVYMIDEAQFFTNLLPFVHLCLRADKVVFVYGLIADFKANLFGELHQLLPHADTVLQLHATCDCGSTAIYSHRVSDTTDVIDAEATYKPMCRRCFNP